MNDAFDFSGKVVLVTGSSRGIGAGIVKTFGDLGARCVVNYVTDTAGRNQSDAEGVARGLPGSILIQGDVGDATQVGAMIDQIKLECGGLDVLVNNAGILRDRSLKRMSAEDWESVLRVNLTGAFNCIQRAAGILRPGGSIVNISSVSGELGFFGQANYASSKAGLMALTKVAARELAKQGITVNSVAPGFVETEIIRDMPEDLVKQFLTQIPAGRLGKIDDIVFPVLFLCSRYARYLTGQVIHVNGGLHMA
jgi:3-oxoacyl-[acyl-carrier protein] reductase